MDENTAETCDVVDQDNNNDPASNAVADCNDDPQALDVEQAHEETVFEQPFEQECPNVSESNSDLSMDSHSQVAQLDDTSFDVTDPAFPDSDSTNCTTSPANVSLAEEMVNVTLYDSSSTHVEDILEGDNLHGLSIHPEVMANNSENRETLLKLSDNDLKHANFTNEDLENSEIDPKVLLQNAQPNGVVEFDQQCSNETCDKNDEASVSHPLQKDDEMTNMSSKQKAIFEPELHTNDVLSKDNTDGMSHHSKPFNHNLRQKPLKSPEANKQVQNMIEENLQKLSPKKEAPFREAKEISSSIVSDISYTPVTPTERPRRVNPFNNIDNSEEHASADLWQTRTSPTNNLPASDLQSFSNHKVNSNLQNHSLSPSLHQNQTLAHSSSVRQETWSDRPSGASSLYATNPHFDLMPSRFFKQQSNDGNFSSSTDDIDEVVREVKMQISSPSEPLDDPWVKLAPQNGLNGNEITPEVQTPVAGPHCKTREPELPKSQKETVDIPLPKQPNSLIRPLIEAAGPCEPSDLIEGIIFAANYLGSTQLQSERNPGKNARMLQAQEAVNRIKAPEGESQPSVEVDLFISTDKVKILNADTQETMMDHTLRSISYIADIGKLLVIMAKRRSPRDENREEQQIMREPKPQRAYRVICHVFSSMDAHLMAQAIGQAFNVAYQQFLTSNGIEPQTLTRDDYNQILDMQDMYHDDLVHYSKRENVKDLWVEKKKGENIGVVIVESGWGSIVPTVILANLQHGGPAERCGKLSIGDQIMNVNGTSLVGLPLATCQSIIKGLRAQTIARLHVVSCPPVVTVLIKRPDLKYQLGFSVQDGIICSLMRGGIAERGGVRVGHRIIEINNQSVVAIQHEKIVQTLVSSVGEIQMKTMPAMMYRLLTGQEQPVYI